ncbi:glutamine--fructose-6-phosphate transaminase (isomerizing) [Helicobacter ailurogastricus]|uniref:glutamine--fructose-6-phosphate transaminase (isomerizing) n=1 Tax=Helicobacter ailurogastricus TaxID=1578720 RepID=UPI00244D920D|nr:glutamine--fructose-6-phosphate transaminase (isomerizing) [Helicobacter ailurogastricus]GMB91163.1 Glucosamine--fructose-6-phosphate aminotransferase GlmS [Helicobacter ailurogastricus]
MCGIMGYLGLDEKKEILIHGLEELEYRGYDSAGLAVLKTNDSHLHLFKVSGKVQALQEKARDFESSGLGVGIAHTRWATHGKPTEANAHPHAYRSSAVVHNGIIENFAPLKAQLQAKGHIFSSQTDSEVVAHLFEDALSQEPSVSIQTALNAFKSTIAKLEGAYAILLICAKLPTCIFYAKERSPLLIAKGAGGIYLASAPSALVGKASHMVRLADGAIGVLEANKPLNLEKLGKLDEVPTDSQQGDKEGFKTFMEKEIYEQGKVLTLLGRLSPKGVALELPEGFLEGVGCLSICACGTSYHAGLVGKYLIESLAGLKVQVELASEYRYAQPATQKGELFIAISQSGESADTLEALKLAKQLGLKTLGICNTQSSSMGALVDAMLLTHAGLERSVASTKAFASQVLVLWLLALQLAHLRGTLEAQEEQGHLQALSTSLEVMQEALKAHAQIKNLSEEITKRDLKGYFFMGRGVFYPLVLEGALKLKEIAYVHAQGYASAEMKHGPIALADSTLLSTTLLPKNLLFAKNLSNVEELSARDSLIFALSPLKVAPATFYLKTPPYPHYMNEFFYMLVLLQLFALEMAQLKGLDVDKPRNLAKSVTVE